ncbi:MAG: outer membrane protein transport protein [Candidatus Eisenbacteria bacterium]
MRSSGSVLIVCLAVLILGPVLALANGFYVPTVGSRAGAMGGAFIGLADDYSAVYWNPAGITQIKGMEVTATGHDVVSLASREGFVRFDGYGGAADRYALGSIAATNRTSNNLSPGFFFLTDAGPLRSVFDKVGVAAYTLSGYGCRWDGDDVLDNADFVDHQHNFNYLALIGETQDYESDMRAYVISPVIANELMPGLSVGVTANFTYGHFQLSDVYMGTYVDTTETPEPDDDYGLLFSPVSVSDDVTGWGYGATVGVLYRASTELSVGATFCTPTTMNYEGTLQVSYDFIPAMDGLLETTQQTLTYASDFTVKYPMWIGGGLAYRDFIFDGLTMTGGAQWTAWSTLESIDRNVIWGGSWLSPEAQILTRLEQSELEVTELQWEDTLEFAVGFDYRLGRSMSISMGYRNSPSPVPDETYDFLMPQSSKNVISGGVSYRQDYWRASFALEYQAGDERRIVGTEDMNGKHVEDLLVPSLSFTYSF